MAQASAPDAAKEPEVSGKVLKTSKKALFIEQDGTVVRLRVDKKTEFGGSSLRKLGDLKSGQEVHASYRVEKGDKVALSVSRGNDLGLGGSGAPDVAMPRDVSSDPGLGSATPAAEMPDTRRPIREGMPEGSSTAVPGNDLKVPTHTPTP